jgi:hypothetical protein
MTSIAADNPEMENQRGKEEEISYSMVPDQDTEEAHQLGSCVIAMSATNKPKERPLQGYLAQGRGVDLI